MKVLVVVDMQRDFIDGALGTPEAVAIVPGVIEKIKEYENAGDLIIFTRDTHTDGYLDTREGRLLPVPHCIEDTEGHEIPPEILRGHNLVIDKPTFGSIELMQYLAHVDFDEVELIGLCTDICVVSNAMLIKARFPEVEISVDSSCCAGVTPESHASALATMRACQINIK